MVKILKYDNPDHKIKLKNQYPQGHFPLSRIFRAGQSSLFSKDQLGEGGCQKQTRSCRSVWLQWKTALIMRLSIFLKPGSTEGVGLSLSIGRSENNYVNSAAIWGCVDSKIHLFLPLPCFLFRKELKLTIIYNTENNSIKFAHISLLI